MPIEESLSYPARTDGYTFRFHTPEIRLTSEPAGFRVEAAGMRVRRGSPGDPDVPSRIVRVAIPEGATPTLRYRVLEQTIRPGVEPSAVPRLRWDVDGKGSPRRSLDFQRNASRYSQRAVAPWVRLGDVGTLRRQRFVEVVVSPIRFDPDVGGIRIATEIEIEIEFGLELDRSAASGLVPSDPVYEPVYRDAFVNYDQGTGFRLESTGPGEGGLSAAAVELAEPRYRIRVAADGVIRLDHGLMSSTALASEPLSTWKVINQGVEVPIEVHDPGADDLLDPGDWVQFVGQALDEEPKTRLNTERTGADLFEARDFTDVNVYFVGVDAGVARARMAVVDAVPTYTRIPPSDFGATAHAEVDDGWRPLASADPWYWLPTLDSAKPNGSDRTIPVPMPGLDPASTSATVRARVRGITEQSSVAPDHRVVVELRNGSNQVLASVDDTFDGRTVHDVSADWLQAGGESLDDPAEVRLEAAALSGGGDHQFITDWVEVDYRRTFDAVGDTLEFDWPDDDAEFVVDGFSSAAITVYEISRRIGSGTVVEPDRIDGAEVSGAGPYAVRFRIDDLGSGAGRRFLLVADGAVTVPSGPDFEVDVVSDLRDPAQQADLIVITHPDAHGAGSDLQDLLDHRLVAQGITSRIGWIEDLEDEFNDGLPGPDAIRRFLEWVLSPEGWSDPKPQFVLIIGDGSYHYKAGVPSGNLVPTQILFKDDPSLGYYASDSILGAVVGDDPLPDIVIGRLTSRSIAETNVQVDKILTYGQSPPSGNWRRHGLFISDRGKNYNVTEALLFEDINEIGIGWMKLPPHTLRHLRYYSDFGGNDPASIRSAIKSAVNGTDGFSDGAATAQFVGHGNFEVWSDDAFMDDRNPPPRDTDDLVNGYRLPWLMVHTCLTGGFHTTLDHSMGEDWMKRDGGGAVAVFGPSGLGSRFIGEVVSDVVHEDVYGPPKERLVAVPTLNSQIALCGQDSIEACQHYVLLGDPTTHLAIPEVAPPTAVDAMGGNAVVDLSWTASTTPGVSYDVYRRKNVLLPYELVGSSGTTSFADTGVANATTYYYYVLARDGEGFESRWSHFNSQCPTGPDCLSAVPLNPNPPAPPQGVQVVDAETGGRLDVTWAASPEDDLREYAVHVGTAPGDYDDAFDAGKATSYVLTGLVNGTRYYVAVTASNTSGLTSDPSVEIDAVPTFIPGLRPPAFVTDLRIDKSGADALLSWGAVTTDVYGKPESVARYEVWRGTIPAFGLDDGTLIGPDVQGTTFLDPAALDPVAPDYYYAVRAVDVDGNGGGLGRQLPEGIADLTLAKSVSVPGNVVLTWSEVTGGVAGAPGPTIIERYDVYAEDAPITPESIRDGLVVPLRSVSGTSAELTPGEQRAYYSVVPVDNRGNRSPY